MAQESRKYSIQQMASVIRERTQQGRNMTDEHLVQEWVKQYPGDREHLDPAGDGLIKAVEFAQSFEQKTKPFVNSAGEEVPKPLPLAGEAARYNGTNFGLTKTLAKDALHSVFDPILPGGQKFQHNYATRYGAVTNPENEPRVDPIYEAGRMVSSPFDAATLGAFSTARLAATSLPKLAKAAVNVDRAGSAALAGLGASSVVDAVSDSTKPMDQRLLEGGLGAAMAALGVSGYKNPIKLPETPIPPAPPRLMLPPVGGTTPTATRFYSGEAGIADVTQQYPKQLFGPTDPLITESVTVPGGTMGTPTLREAGQIYNIPPIEAARGPRLSGLHGTGAPKPFNEEAAAADMARQIQAAQEKAAAKQPLLLPAKTTGPVVPPGSVPQTGLGGVVNFKIAEKLGNTEFYSVLFDGQVVPFETLDEAIEFAADNGIREISRYRPDGRVDRLPLDDGGFARPELLRPMVGGMAGALTGAAAGETPQERIKLGIAGVVAGTLAGRPRKAAKLDIPPIERQPIPVSHGTGHDWAAERLIVDADGTQRFIVGEPFALPDVPPGATVLRDFPLGRPRMDKIGTGEGATAFSRGLYTAAQHNSPVAAGYRAANAGGRVLLDGKALTPTSKGPIGAAVKALMAHGGNVDTAVDELRWMANRERRAAAEETQRYLDVADQMGLSVEPKQGRRVARYERAADFLEANKHALKYERTGGVYNMELRANENHMIHWDEPFDRQPEYVRKKLAQIIDINPTALRAWSGRDIYKALTGQEGLVLNARKNEHLTEEQVVELLRKNGIKGVKYLDGDSRARGNGTYNYVAFDENILEVLGKETGSASPELLKKMATSAVGGIGGSAMGDTPQERLKLGVLGAVAGPMLVKGKQHMPKGNPYVSDEGARLLKAQAKEGRVGDSSILPFSTKAKRNLLSRFAPNDHLDAVVEQQIKRPLRAAEQSGSTNRAVLGGQMGRVRAAMLDLTDLIKVAKSGGYDEEVRNILNMQAILHGHKTLLKRAAKLTGKEQQELLKRVNTGETFPLRITKQKAEQILREAQKSPNFQKAQEIAEKVFKFNRDSLDMLYQEGMITKEGYEELISRGENYVPLFRRSEGGLIDEVDLHDLTANIEREMTDRWRSAGLSTKRLTAIQKLHGSERITQDPLQASLYLRQLTEREIGRNEAAHTLYNLRNIEGAQMDELIVPLTIYGKDGKKIIGKKSPPIGMAEVTFRKDGEVFAFAVPKEIAQAQLLIDGKSLVAGMSALGEFLGGAKTIQQAAATGVNVPFAFTNVFRDFRTARRILATNKMTPANWLESWNEWRKALASRLVKDEAFREVLRSRAMHGTLQEQILPTDLVLGGRKFGLGKRFINSVAELNRIMEETGKMASYNLLRKRGISLDEAVKEARAMGGSPDFADMGTKIAEGFNLMFMFLNPAIKGIEQNVKAIARNPGKAAVQLGIATGASIAMYNWNSQFVDENGEPEMQHVPKHDRDTSFVFIMPWKDEKTGRNFYFKLPKSHADRLFYNATQDAIDMAAGDEHTSTGQIGLDVASQFLPGNVGAKSGEVVSSVLRNVGAMANPVIRIPAEIIGNKKFFEDVPIESKRLEAFSPENRYDSTTGATYRKIADLMPDAFPEQLRSPKMWQHGVEGLFSAPGRDVMRLLDSAQRPTSIKLEGFDTVKKFPILGGVANRFVGGGTDYKLSQDIDLIYKQLEKSKQIKTDYKGKREESKEEFKAAARVQKPLDAITRDLAKLRKLREAIMSGENPTSDPKGQLRVIRDKERKLVATAKRLTKEAK